MMTALPRWRVPARFSALVCVSSLAATVIACGGEAPKAATPAPSASAPPSTQDVVVPATSIRRSALRHALEAGPGAFLQRVELDDRPAMLNGKFHGFRITALKGDPAAWQGVDLKPGDVVTLVNGKTIERPQDAFDVFHGLEVAKELRVDYERDGQPKSFTMPIVDDEPRSAR